MVEQPFRLRINYQKVGRLTHLSHLEVVRALERVVRRSQLPYAITTGFSVHMKHAFGPALPVGTGGLDEYLDVWLTDYVPMPAALRSLQEVAPENLPVIAVHYVEKSAPSLQVSHRFSTYEVLLRANDEQLASLRRTSEELLNEGCLNVQRKGKIKVFELSRYLLGMPEIRIVREGVIRLEFILIADENGSLRPENLMAGLCDGSEKLDVISITRIQLNESL